MKLILVRHGVREGEKWLTDKDRIKAKELAKAIDDKIDVIYCSPTAKCVETMEAFLDGRQEEMEIHMCRLVGPKTKEETEEKAKNRIKLFLDDLKHELDNDQTAVVFGHGKLLTLMMEEINDSMGEEIVELEAKFFEIEPYSK